MTDTPLPPVSPAPRRRLRLGFLRRWSRWHSVLAATLVAAYTAAAINGWHLFAPAQMVLDNMAAINAELVPGEPLTGRILLLSPHPDDETLAAGGLLTEAVMRGQDVWVVFVTSGDAFPWSPRHTVGRWLHGGQSMVDLGQLRIREARAAVSTFGVAADRVIFLGFPDKGLTPMITRNYLVPYRSWDTEADRVPYREAYRYGAPYTGLELTRQLRQILREVQPDVVLAPSVLDGHPDHRAVAYFMNTLWEEFPRVKLAYYLVHGGAEWPLPKGYHPTLTLTPPQADQQGDRWRTYPLEAEMIERKREAVLAYPSQTSVIGRFMWAFVRRNELLLPARREDLTEQGAQD
ncbi:LmbE family N-acetylglucosaminyl deacetylase [Deinobacterium chartae]|uniref:LmbE family N-acetylglucosaminyl deacetylase n=1 Tax=Deinobacterium chartae TaxID=521158 RepID=A0A841I450_9DEIO|nr:PIG-L family deacetylase [Deinobacterium chartae]MBB6099190.1 LmbE family N-acetylglucosaminyl deacetylase [Deinobacterium chartae]